MMKILHVLLQKAPAAIQVSRVISDGAISHVDENFALAQHSAAAEISREGSIATSEEIIQELESSDAVVMGTPMHNFSVSSALKAWIDHVVRARRIFNISEERKV
jgi:FMN-dependent NADH-azoreductase